MPPLPFWSVPELIAACVCWTIWGVGLSLRPVDPAAALMVRSYRMVTFAVNALLTSFFLAHSGQVSAHDALWVTYLIAATLPAIGMRLSRKASGQPIETFEVIYWLICAICFGGLLFAPNAFVGPNRINPLGYPQASSLLPGLILTVTVVSAVTWSIWDRFRRGAFGSVGGLRWLTLAWLVYNTCALLEQVSTSGWLVLPPMFWIGALALTLEFARVIHAHQGSAMVKLGQANAALTELKNDLEQRVQDRTEALERLAMFDPLTGLANRTHAERNLEQAIEHAQQHQRSVVILMMDLNRFKNINDTAGHFIGDAVLREVAKRFRQHLPDSALLARLGGDEFLLVFPDLEPLTPAASSLGVPEHVSQDLIKVLSAPVRIGHTEFFVGVSIGISQYPKDGQDAATLLRLADIAMYRAKREGLGYRVFDLLLDEDVAQRIETERQMRHAIETDAGSLFELHYQPIVRLPSREIVGVEALLRWNDPLRPLSPAEFIPIAEESRLIVPLGNWVLETACRQAMQWQHDGLPEVYVSVNVSIHQFERPDFVDTVKRTLSLTNLPANQLVLELVESVMVDRFDDTAAKIAQLRSLGVRLALDDFGMGYSNLSYLHHLTFDTLKIDRSFTRMLGEVNRPRALMAAALSIANEFGIGAVVEGVETLEQAHELEILGCSLAQGYLFSRPLSTAQATQVLRHGLNPRKSDIKR